MYMHCFVKNSEKKASTLNFQKYLIEATWRNSCRFFYARKVAGLFLYENHAQNPYQHNDFAYTT